MPSAPEEVFRRLLDLMLKKEMDAVADLWAVDGTAEFPFAAGDAPRRLMGAKKSAVTWPDTRNCSICGKSPRSPCVRPRTRTPR